MRMLEICCGDLDSVKAACAGGAHRIELCSALSEGGVTPSIGLIEAAIAVAHRAGVKVHVLIRPRAGDFLYSPAEVEVMKADIAAAKRAGADGVVIGALTADGDVDVDAVSDMMGGTDGMSVTFHRAFDVCRQPEKALADIISLGCQRLLTSGCMPSAELGISQLKKLNALAANKIILLAGAGVSSANARKIIQEAGVNELHASARSSIGSEMEFRRSQVSMGAPGADEYARKVTDPLEVKAIRREMERD